MRYEKNTRKSTRADIERQKQEEIVNARIRQFDVYFPKLDLRAALLRPLTETKTLGLLDVNCTIKGGGVSGQIGAIRLAGFLTRDSRIVERKKPGKAKARKSFQWVKR
ncbi:Ribosomal protein S5 domain 2-type fold [Artemisia annua]|uniref:Ribosomal protein S5 domain 2-type fold n=1 Tax=Artemisia annua TaxID=35608 RepID=A0A2U1KJ97_ARTAN|nr:Ribosomal protein S5 domain 2-type fold [Artemisia annua]